MTEPHSPITKLGIIAGGGSLPDRLVHACDQRNIDVFIIGFDGQTDPRLMQGRAHHWTRYGTAADIFKVLKQQGVQDLVMIGAMKRPSVAELRPDFATTALLMRIGLSAFGDDGLLSAIRKLLESEGFTLHGIQEFAADLLAPAGAVGQHTPSDSDWDDIRRGLEVARALGSLDVGQACVVQESLILGVEGVEGTNGLIDRTGDLKKDGPGPILVKVRKPQQDNSLDLPTIGPETIERAVYAGFRGIVFEAGTTLLIDPETVAEQADQANVYVYGLEPDAKTE